MRIMTLLTLSFGLMGNAHAATLTETILSDGTRTVVTHTVSFALVQNQGMIAAALFAIAIIMLAAAIWLMGRGKAPKPNLASRFGLSLLGKVSAKIVLGAPALLIGSASILSILAAIVATLQSVYTATL